MGATGFLVVSILLSFISIVTTHLKIVKLSKDGFLPFTAKIVLAFKVFLAAVLRIAIFFFYFAPFLGLLNLLAHWQADQTPFANPLFQNKSYTYWDLTDNTTKTVPFKKLHLTYPGSEPPHYSHYTVLGLGQAYLVFWAVLGAQLVVVLLTKQRLSQQFRQAGLGSKLLHSLLCLNIPDIHQDWDKQEEGEIKTVEMFRERREEVITEKAVTQIIHCLFNLILLSPIIVTGIHKINKILV